MTALLVGFKTKRLQVHWLLESFFRPALLHYRSLTPSAYNVGRAGMCFIEFNGTWRIGRPGSENLTSQMRTQPASSAFRMNKHKQGCFMWLRGPIPSHTHTGSTCHTLYYTTVFQEKFDREISALHATCYEIFPWLSEMQSDMVMTGWHQQCFLFMLCAYSVKLHCCNSGTTLPKINDIIISGVKEVLQFPSPSLILGLKQH